MHNIFYDELNLQERLSNWIRSIFSTERRSPEQNWYSSDPLTSRLKSANTNRDFRLCVGNAFWEMSSIRKMYSRVAFTFDMAHSLSGKCISAHWKVALSLVKVVELRSVCRRVRDLFCILIGNATKKSFLWVRIKNPLHAMLIWLNTGSLTKSYGLSFFSNSDLFFLIFIIFFRNILFGSSKKVLLSSFYIFYLLPHRILF